MVWHAWQMAIVDKNGLLPKMRGARIELGCGSQKQDPDAVGVDALDSPATDIVGDAFEVLAEIPDGFVSRISSAHFFEHIVDQERLLSECARVLEAGGTMLVTVPHFSNPYFYSDPTHRTTFGLYTFSYLARADLFARAVPTYGNRLLFDLADVRLIFRSDTPAFARRDRLKRRFERYVNSSRDRQEFYEENLCYLIPCYELTYTLVRVPSRRAAT